MRCPYCGFLKWQVKAGRNASGSQRYKCQKCSRIYTPERANTRYPRDMRDRAIWLFYYGWSFRRISRTLRIHHQTVINWVKSFASPFFWSESFWDWDDVRSYVKEMSDWLPPNPFLSEDGNIWLPGVRIPLKPR